MIPGGDGPLWVKVEMYGLLPPGRGAVNAAAEELIRFGRSLGFTHIDGFTVVLADPPMRA